MCQALSALASSLRKRQKRINMKKQIVLTLFIFFSAGIYCQDKTEDDFSLKNKESDMNSRMAAIYLDRAKQRKADGDTDTANADYEKAYRLDPKLSDKFKDLRISLDAGKWMKRADDCLYNSEKITCYKKAIKADPRCTDAYYYLGKYLYKEKYYKDAAKAFHDLLEIDPKYSGAEKFLQKAENEFKKTLKP